MSKEVLVNQIKEEIKVFNKRYHLVKARIFKEALDFLETFDEETAYELLMANRDREVGTDINFASSEVSSGYTDLSTFFKKHFREQKRAAKAAPTTEEQ